MSSEKSTYGRFRSNLLSRVNRIDRVENLIVPGMPDVNCCFGNGHPFADGGTEFWIEIKTPREPVRATTPLFGSNHPIGRDQINWHRYHAQCGGRSFFLIDTNKRLLLMSGARAEEINGMTVGELVAASLFCEPKPMRAEKWMRLKRTLMA